MAVVPSTAALIISRRMALRDEFSARISWRSFAICAGSENAESVHPGRVTGEHHASLRRR